MIVSDPLESSLLDLHMRLCDRIRLIVGGGYGLYLKQRMLEQQSIPTRFAKTNLPSNRTTEDIDLFLRAEVVVDAARMKIVRDTLDALGYRPVTGSEYMQFSKAAPHAGEIKVDLMVGPLGELFDPMTVKRDERRVRPKDFGLLHAHPVDEAVALEDHLMPIIVSGDRQDGCPHAATVYVPQSFTYLLMKLFAFNDRVRDGRKDFARHHAMDIYRIIGLITKEEDEVVRNLAAAHREDLKAIKASEIVAEYFAHPDRLGVLRMREHQMFLRSMNIEEFITDLVAIFPPR